MSETALVEAEGPYYEDLTFPAVIVLPEGAGALALEIPLESPALATFLAGHAQTCMFTSYTLELELPVPDSPGVVRRVPLADMTDLTPLRPFLPQPPARAVIRMAFANYDVLRVRHHVRRFREILACPPVHGVAGATTAGLSGGEVGVEGGDEAPSKPPKAPGGVMDSEWETTLREILDEKTTGPLLGTLVQQERLVANLIPKLVASVPMPVPTSLATVYPLPNLTRLPAIVKAAQASGDWQAALGVAPALDAHTRVEDSVKLLIGEHLVGPAEAAGEAGLLEGPLTGTGAPLCLRSLTFSGWNPPPAPRRLAGDLAYIRLQTLEGRALHVTACASGFYVNKTQDDGAFDPEPAQPPHFSRTLWGLLHRVSAGFKTSYRKLISSAVSAPPAAALEAGDSHDILTGLDVPFVLPHAGRTGSALTARVAAAAAAVGGSNGAGPATPTLDVLGSGIGSTLHLSASGSPLIAAADLSWTMFASRPAVASAYGIAVPPCAGFAVSRAPWAVPVVNPAAGPVPELTATSDGASGEEGSSSSSASSGGSSSSSASGSNSTKRGAASSSGGGGSSGAGGKGSSAGLDGQSAASSLIRGEHQHDDSRAEDDLLNGFGMLDRGALRDWNEDWQSIKDMPNETMEDKTARRRAITKALSDFVDAATQGAMAIVLGHVTPLNPSEDPRSHVYEFNNIFFSISLDADTKEAVRKQRVAERAAAAAAGGGPEAAVLAAWGLVSAPAGTAPGAAVATSSVMAGTDASADGAASATTAAAVTAGGGVGPWDDLASLASPNHDLQGIMRVAELDVPDIYTLMTAIIHYMGHCLVAQSIIPGILQSESTARVSRLVYGSTDDGNTVFAEPEVHAKIGRLAPALHIAESRIVPLGGGSAASVAADATVEEASASASPAAAPTAPPSPVHLHGAVECKGIVGSDGRTYLLDMVRTTPKDVGWYDAAVLQEYEGDAEAAAAARASGYLPFCRQHYETGYVPLLRPELLKWFHHYQRVKARLSATRQGGDEQQQPAEAEAPPPLLLDVNVYTRFLAGLSDEERAAREAPVRELCAHLHDTVLPSLLSELVSSPASAPHDGEMVTALLHSRGVNVRYLGRMAEWVASRPSGRCPPYLLELLELEMVARVARRGLEALLRDEPACRAAPAVTIAGYLNALLGSPAPTEAAGVAAAHEALAAALAKPSSSGGAVDAAALGAVAKEAAAAAAAAASKRKGKAGNSGKAEGGVEGGGSSSASAPASGVAAAPVGATTMTTVGPATPVPDASTIATSPADLIRLSCSFPAGEVPTPASLASRALVNAGITHEGVWAAVTAGVAKHFRYSLKLWKNGGYDTVEEVVVAAAAATTAMTGEGSAVALPPLHKRLPRCPRVPLLRRLCQRVGLQVASKPYMWSCPTPFHPSGREVMGIFPVVKSCMPRNVLPEAAELVARLTALAETDLQQAAAAAQEAMAMVLPVWGVAHADVGACGSAIAAISEAIGDSPLAVKQQLRVVTLFERLFGADHHETIAAHSALATYLSSADAHNAAIRHQLRAIAMLQIATVPSHPVLAEAYAKLAALYQRAHNVPAAIRCLNHILSFPQEARAVAEYLHALALAHASMGDFSAARLYESHVASILEDKLGPEAVEAKEAAAFVELFGKKGAQLQAVAAQMAAAIETGSLTGLESALERGLLHDAAAAMLGGSGGGSGGGGGSNSGARPRKQQHKKRK